MTTVANIFRTENAHYYRRDGTPCHQVPNKSNGGMRPTTLKDARKLDLLPSVTTILSVLRKPGLERWLIEQAVLAVISDPGKPLEDLDAKIDRVLNQERQQDEESQRARDLGTRIHDAMERHLTCAPQNESAYESDWDLLPFIQPALAVVREHGRVIFTERVLVGDGYAGKTDCGTEGDALTLWDFKSTSSKTLPAKSYLEHRLQLSAYAKAMGSTGNKRIVTANLYISTSEPGKLSLCLNQDWQQDWKAFEHLLAYFKIVNNL